MLKKIKYLLLIQFLISVPASANEFYVELSYTSFRPYIHFQLDFESYGYNEYDAYQSSYLKGYMDGVNTSYHYSYDRHDPYWYENAYEAGYRDGFRDHRLLIRLRGQAWYHKHRFVRHHYYSPYYSVRIWLDGLSFSFLHAPAHYLPARWEYYVHPRVKKYRRSLAYRHHNNRGYYKGHHKIERVYRKRISQYRKQAQYHRKTHRYRGHGRYDKRPNYDHTYRKRKVAEFGKRERVQQKRTHRQELQRKRDDNRAHRKRIKRQDSEPNRSFKRNTERNRSKSNERSKRSRKRDH